MDDVDPLEAIDKVIAEVGYCWFGKYGRPIRAASIEPTKKYPESLAVLTMYVPTKGGHPAKRVSRTFKIVEITTRFPTDKAYPKYYKKVLGRISTWIKLEVATQLKLEELYTKSSSMPVSTSLANSMAAHFLVRRKGAQ
jgi:uncharacterized membrane protein